MKITYKPEIDGLRAIAVLSVVIYHLQFELNSSQVLVGGFIGVDIFFVISGYLISKILLKELVETKTICVKNFYIKRARRILPVLFFIILIFFIISYFYSLPPFLENYAKSSLSTIFFVSNFYFLLSHIDYGNIVSNLNPLLHTWTLSVEEQFYITFPFILLIVNKYFTKKILSITILLFSISVILNLSLEIINIYVDKYHQYNFYLFPTRAWELLIGTLIAILDVKKKKTSSLILGKYIPDIGFVIILLSLFFIKLENSYLILKILFPCIGTALIIFFSNNKSYTIKFLSSKLLVSVGLISYSIYLWHFPIISIINLNDISEVQFLDFNINKIKIFILIIFLSSFSYKFIEKPFRSQNIFSTKKLLLIISTISLTLITLIIISIKTDGLKYRYSKFYNNYNNYELSNRNLHIKWSETHSGFHSKESNFNKDLNKKNVLIIGNSFAVDYFNMFNENKEYFSDYNFSLLRIDANKLILFQDKFEEFKNADLVIFGTKFDSKKTNVSFKESFKLVKQEILLLKNLVEKEQKKLLVFLSRPEFGLQAKNEKLKYFPIIKPDYKNNYTILDKFIHKKIKNNKRVMNKDFINWKNEYYNYLMQDKIIFNTRLKKFLKTEDIDYLNPFDYSCNHVSKKCDVVTSNYEKIYFDYGHYTLEGAKYFGKKINYMQWIDLHKFSN